MPPWHRRPPRSCPQRWLAVPKSTNDSTADDDATQSGDGNTPEDPDHVPSRIPQPHVVGEPLSVQTVRPTVIGNPRRVGVQPLDSTERDEDAAMGDVSRR